MHTSGALRREIESAYPFGCLKIASCACWTCGV